MSVQYRPATSEEISIRFPSETPKPNNTKKNLDLLKKIGAFALTCFAAHKLLPLAKNCFLSLATKYPLLTHGAVGLIALPVGAFAFLMYLDFKVFK